MADAPRVLWMVENESGYGEYDFDFFEAHTCPVPLEDAVKYVLASSLEDSEDESGKADWVCTRCHKQNNGLNDKCWHCGIPASESKGEQYADV